MSQTLLLQVSVGNTYGYVYRKEDSPQAQAAAKEFENGIKKKNIMSIFFNKDIRVFYINFYKFSSF